MIASDQPAGTLSAATAKSLGLSTDTVVSAGGGDNMMGAIGTGNTRPGIVTAIGTSGTIYACAGEPVIDPEGEIAAFCDSTNRWLPLLCTMNVTVATEMVREHYGLSHAQYEKAAAKVGAGSDGLILCLILKENEPQRAGGHRCLAWRQYAYASAGAFCSSRHGRRDDRDELRLAPIGGLGCEGQQIR